MKYVTPKHSNAQINRAGDILVAPEKFTAEERSEADKLLAHWRAAHGYPINTFQATLRKRLERLDDSAAIAQRLKRTPSIVIKLRLQKGMQLARMQDIAGLRAIVNTVNTVRKLEEAYRTSRFTHTLISSKNYLDQPKADGYRGVHLIYRYQNPLAPEYNGLSLELQIRTRLQHAWATAVETMGTFLGQGLKSGLGEQSWRDYFSIAGAALAHYEKTATVPGFEGRERADIIEQLNSVESDLRVLQKLKGFAIAANRITTEKGQGAYHLVVLDSGEKTVSIRPYPISKLEQANIDLAAFDQRTKEGELIDAVVVSAGPIGALRKAYPNYFLDTQAFVSAMKRITVMHTLFAKRRLGGSVRLPPVTYQKK